MATGKTPVLSSLSRTAKVDGWQLDVEIHREGKKWRLEVIDERGTHNVWTELFTSEQAALDEALAGFARAPTPEGWRGLMRFAPPEYFYQRTRDAIRRLRKLGVDGDSIFRCASEYGITPDLIELVEDGCVAVETIVERGARTRAARTTYIGLAAEAAFLKGDMLGTVRLLRESMAYENEWCSVLPHVFFIRERASPEQKELLDRAGIPQA